MASKIKSVYICSECGYESPKWYGKCPSCGEWNTMNEEIKDTSKQSATAKERVFAVADCFDVSLISSFIVFHSPHEGHFPYHLGDSYPHSEHM